MTADDTPESPDTPKGTNGGGGGGAAQPAQEQAPPLKINGQYIKDLSFEIPGAPEIFKEMHDESPTINVSVNVDGKQIQDQLYEVVLAIRAECKIGESVGFILELIYAGMFTVNVPQEQTQFILLVECPRHLFPFARNIVCDVTRDGGFPPMMLDPIDFVSMLQNTMKEAAAQSGEPSETKSEPKSKSKTKSKK